MRLLRIALLGSMMQFANAQLTVSPFNTVINSGPGGTGTFFISDAQGGHVKFKYVSSETPGFVVVVPSSGTTPATVHVGMNPAVTDLLPPGFTYIADAQFMTVDQSPASTATARASVVVSKIGPPSIGSVVNAASLQPLLSPGALVAILGSRLTGPTLSTNYGDTGSYPTTVAGTKVTFNGIAAPLLYVSPGQINAIVPFALAGQTSVQVVVQRFTLVSVTFTLPLEDTSPAIFTAAQNGSGQGAIVQGGSDGQFTYNSSDNPAPRGAALEIFGTGAGVWTPPAQSDVFLLATRFTTQPVSVTIGGQTAQLLYAGTQGVQATWSVLQVNTVVPDGVGSGPQRVVLKIGANDNSQQNVTVWVK